jgi:hypothetical protein
MEKEIGKLYYDISYSDEALLCPIIKPMIFLGQGIDNSEKNNDDLLYFQDPESYSVIGSAYFNNKKSSQKLEIQVYSFSASAPWPVVDVEGLRKELVSCEKRWSKT